MIIPILFQSTPSVRRATDDIAGKRRTVGISIHALREEGDVEPIIAGFIDRAFQSTPSVRRATAVGVDGSEFHPISIHALREEGDQQLFKNLAGG